MKTIIIIIIAVIWCGIVTGGYIWLDKQEQQDRERAKHEQRQKKN